MTGGAWLSSARVVRCWVSPATSATLVYYCYDTKVSEIIETAGDKPEEGEDDVKSACPLCPGRHTCYNGRDNEMLLRENTLTSKTRS